MRTRRLASLAAALAVALSLSACGSSTDEASGAAADTPTVTVDHAQGTTDVPVNPDKVVVFDMGVLDTLTALDVPVAGVPKDYLPEYLSQYEAEEYLNAGTLFEPDYEAVNAADPDLIVVAGRSAEAYADLSDIAPTVDLTLDSASFLASFKEQTTTLGQIFERRDQVRQALSDLDARIDEVKKAGADAGTGLVVLTTGGQVSAYGAGSRFGMVHDVLGVGPADPDIKADTHGEAVSFEYIADTNPDWLFVVDRDVATGESEGGAAQAVLDNELVAGTTAWQQDQVVYLDPVSWYIVGGGLTTMNDMVSEVGEALS